ncbi:MAG: carbohydrate-binding domain-containing protein [Muribaculaceae bacterium]|nr:carbohydrate-binding domain-containing protein [Muribaculaceae bacterium]
MKNSYLLIGGLLLAASAPILARTLNVISGNVTYSFPISSTDEITFKDGKSFSIGNKEFAISESLKMTTDESVPADNTVTVTYEGETATVNISGNIADYVDATVDGAHVAVTQSADVNDEVGEITYTLSGESPDGSFTMTGSYKATLELRGLTLTNPSGAALDIQNGKRIELSAKNGTVNTLTDGAGGSQKGCIYCKGHLELKGKGELNVYGKKSHAVNAKEYIEMKNLTLNILESQKDGLNCNQYFLMESGKLNINNVGDDGVQVSFKDDVDREAEDTGTATINGGEISINVNAVAAKGIKADGDLIVNGGKFNITVSGNGKWDEAASKTKAASCLSSDGKTEINGGTFELTASGSGGKGINCDGAFTMTDGELTIATTGGMFAYQNNKENHNFTGNYDRIDSSLRSSPKGVKADGDVNISGGKIRVTTKGNGGEGIESKNILTISGGEIFAHCYDDAINSSSHMYIDGGDITVIATANDGLDSNGNLYLRGGRVMAFGAGSPECGIDANEEEGYSVFFTGGYLLACGGNNSTPRSTASTQPYISGTNSVKAGNEVILSNAEGTIVSFTIPEEYNSSSTSGGGWRPGGSRGGGLLITAPELKKGSSYTLKYGTTTSTLTAQ